VTDRGRKNINAAPFLKWAGGKSQILASVRALVPERFGHYFEPFIGGGAVFFRLASQGLIGRATLGDANPHLITTYGVVRDKPQELIEALDGLKTAHSPDNFYMARSRFNDGSLSDVDRAAHLIYLNKTCFNGLYRVNSSGGFNVPVGRYVKPGIYKADHVMECSRVLAGTNLVCGDFDGVLPGAVAGDFVYLDPPYVPLTKTANFTSYARDDFGFDDQVRLAEATRRLDAAGVKFLLSNHATPELLDLYKGFAIDIVPARRMITRNAGDRASTVDECLVRNY